MRLAQGKGDAAAAAIQRALSETELPLKRVALFPASVEILVATGDVVAARAACDELSVIARRQGSEALTALAAQAEGAVALAEGDARSALPLRRGAWQAWQELEAPYDAARARVLIARPARARTTTRPRSSWTPRATRSFDSARARSRAARGAHRQARARRPRADGARARSATSDRAR